MVLVFEEEVIRVICAYASQVGRAECEKDRFYNDMASGVTKALVKWFVILGISTDMLGDELMVLRVCMVGTESAKEMLREEDYSSFATKKSYARQIHGLKRSREK